MNVLIFLMISFVYADCDDIDNQEDCERMEGCEWIESDNMPEGGACVEGDWDDDEEWEDCSDIDNQEDCERIESCEWTDELGCYESSEGESLENNQIPSYSLLQNYPNPFNPITTINFSILESGNVSLIVYDISGKEVSKLIDGFYAPGNYAIKWNAIDYYGSQLSSGIYIYRLKTKNSIFSNRMILIR